MCGDRPAAGGSYSKAGANLVMSHTDAANPLQPERYRMWQSGTKAHESVWWRVVAQDVSCRSHSEKDVLQCDEMLPPGPSYGTIGSHSSPIFAPGSATLGSRESRVSGPALHFPRLAACGRGSSVVPATGRSHVTRTPAAGPSAASGRPAPRAPAGAEGRG